VDKPPFLQVRLDDVKMDFLKFPYDFVQDFIEVEGVRLVAIENRAIMKLLAIARRGDIKMAETLQGILPFFIDSQIFLFFK
jgi:hypothetical protein